MSRKSLTGAIGAATLGLFSAFVFAQQQTSPSQDKSGSGPMGRGMMGAGMMMGQMITRHQEMSQLMNEMMQSMAAINNEKDPGKLKALLAEHAALLDQMRMGMMGQGKMMQNMAGQMKNCPGMRDSDMPASK
jgi:hypothetical protein